MKTVNYLLGFWGAMGMIACSSSNDVVDNGSNDSKSQNHFISISVKSANDAATRAVVEGEPTEDPKDGRYEFGTGAEISVTKACFYFFKANGDAADVVKLPAGDGKYVNYYETNVEKKEDESPNVEQILKAVVVINTKDNYDIPDKIVAVLNAEPLKNQNGTSMSLSQLSQYAANFRSNASGFVMSSTVYAKDRVTKMEADEMQGHFHTSETEAEADPVEMYVERVLAKVSVAAKMAENEGNIKDAEGNTLYYYTGQTSDKSDNVDKRLYVKFLGWNIATETKTSYLLKNINPAWTDNDLGIVNWTWPNYFRSFWAMNPQGVEYENHDFNAAANHVLGTVDNDGYVEAKEFDEEGNKKTNYTYVHENANPYSEAKTAAAPEMPTKIIVASQLVDKEGNPVDLAEWRGLRSTKAGVLTSMANFSDIYYKTGDNTREKITPEMIKFADDGTYVVLKDSEKDKTFYLSSTDTDAADADAVNAKLKERLGTAKVWKDGQCYYFTDIRHLGQITPATDDAEEQVSAGAYGVVRNHSYQVIVNSVTGLGTPVYNPDEIIDPEIPQDEESYLAAQIKVLSWRVVKSTVDLK